MPRTLAWAAREPPKTSTGMIASLSSGIRCSSWLPSNLLSARKLEQQLDQIQAFQTAVGMVRDDCDRTGLGNLLETRRIELETNLQYFQRFTCELSGRQIASGQLAMNIGQSLKRERALGDTENERTDRGNALQWSGEFER